VQQQQQQQQSKAARPRAAPAAAAMARRYDSRTTIFSPEGRLYQARTLAPSRRRAALTPPCAAA